MAGDPKVYVVLFRTAPGGAGTEWRFRICGLNHETLAQSEGYARRQAAYDTARLIVGPDVGIREEA